jgi:hypothetical protein
MARPNAVRHDWPRRELTAVLEDLPAPPIRTGAAGAAIRAWERWQDGLTPTRWSGWRTRWGTSPAQGSGSPEGVLYSWGWEMRHERNREHHSDRA